MDVKSGEHKKMSWQVHKAVKQDWRGWRNESESWFQREGDAAEWLVIVNEEKVGGRERVTTEYGE